MRLDWMGWRSEAAIMVFLALFALVFLRVFYLRWRRGGTGRRSAKLRMIGFGSRNMWYGWREDTWTGLVAMRPEGQAKIGLVGPHNQGFSIHDGAELRRVELILGGKAVLAAYPEPGTQDGLGYDHKPWPVSRDGRKWKAIPGPIGIRVILEPSAPEGYEFITSDGPAPAKGHVMVTTYGWYCRMLGMMAGRDFMDDRYDHALLSSRLELARAEAALEALRKLLPRPNASEDRPAANP